MIEAVEAVRERALRATKALRDARVPYAVAGGNAVAAWVARVDRAAVRNMQDVDILGQRSDFETVKRALESVGFVYHQVMDVDRRSRWLSRYFGPNPVKPTATPLHHPPTGV